MSIASGFRDKWHLIAAAADASRGQGADARYAQMQRAADDAGLRLAAKAEFGAYQRRIAELDDRLALFDQMREALDEIECELDRQLYDDEYVKSCRDNDLAIPPDCEHHVVVTEALRKRIGQVLSKVEKLDDAKPNRIEALEKGSVDAG